MSPKLDDRLAALKRRLPGPPAKRRSTAAPRRGAKRTVRQIIAQLPHYARLLGGLLTDRRVPALDKALVGVALAYLLLPLDFISDFIPFFGQVDDVYLLMLAMQRLVRNADRRVLRRHWTGDPRELRNLDVGKVVQAAAFFLPGRLKRNLRSLVPV